MTEEREPAQKPFDAMFDAALDMAIAFPDRKTGNEWSEWREAGFRLDIDDGPEKAIKLSAIVQSFGQTALLDRLEEPGKYAKANRDGTRFLHRASIDFSTGETEYTDYMGTYAELNEVDQLEKDPGDFLMTPAALFDKVLTVPLDDSELSHVLERYYRVKDESSRVGRRSAPYEKVVERFVPILAQRDDDSRQRLVASMANIFEQSDRSESHITQFNEKLVEYIVKQPPHERVDDEYRTQSFSLMQTMGEAGLLRTRPLASIAMTVIPGMPGILLDMKRSGIDVFEGRANAERMSYAQNYVYTLFDHLQKTPGRHYARIQLIREKLFQDKHRTTLSWQHMLKFANGITTGMNTGSTDGDKREMLPATETAENFSYLGEALFRILEVTSHTSEQTNSNREYAELLEAILQPLYEHFGRSPTYMSVADLCARYPELSSDQLEDMINAADRGGYSLASEQYTKVRREYGKRVGWEKREPGSGIIS